MANIQNNLNKIKNAVLGVDVRDSIHDGIKAINEEVENTTDRQVQLEGTFDELVINAGNSNAEVAAARVDSTGKSHGTLGKRLNNFDSQIKDKANTVDLAVERARIDNLASLSEGSTTGDAELIDARIGADGIIYDNLGKSIRTQFSLNNEVINSILHSVSDVFTDGSIIQKTEYNISSFTKESNISTYYNNGVIANKDSFLSKIEFSNDLDNVKVCLLDFDGQKFYKSDNYKYFESKTTDKKIYPNLFVKKGQYIFVSPCGYNIAFKEDDNLVNAYRLNEDTLDIISDNYKIVVGFNIYLSEITLKRALYKEIDDINKEIVSINKEIDDLFIRKRNYISVFHDNFAEINSDWVEINCETDAWLFNTVNKTLKPNRVGGYENNNLKNVIGLNRLYEADKRICKIVTTLYSDTVMNLHFYRTSSTGQAPNESMYIIDWANNKIKMCKNVDRYVLTDNFSKETNFNVLNGKKHIIELEKDNYTFSIRIKNFNTGEILTELSLSGWDAGTQIQYYGLSLSSGTPFLVHEIDVSILNEPNICFVGDSITEGYGMQANLDKRFVDLIRKNVDNCIVSAGSSDKLNDVITKFKSEYSIIKPKVLFVTISTNDDSITIEQLKQLKNLCDSSNIKLILNHIPSNNITSKTMNYIEKNEIIDELNVQGCKFDVSTSINKDILQGIDMSLFTDGVHPNIEGSKNMYNRVLIDTNLI